MKDLKAAIKFTGITLMVAFMSMWGMCIIASPIMIGSDTSEHSTVVIGIALACSALVWLPLQMIMIKRLNTATP